MPPTPQHPTPSTPAVSRRGALAIGGGAVLGAATLPGFVLPASAKSSSDLDRIFDRLAEKHGVPRDLLVAVGYTETHLNGHNGEPSVANGYGLMHLVQNSQHKTLKEAADLTGRPAGALKRNPVANIDGAAAVLSAYATDARMSAGSRKDINAWYPIVARYSGASGQVAHLYAGAVYNNLSTGASANGVAVDSRGVDPDREGVATDGSVSILSTDYGPAHWRPAHSSNYTDANRPSSNPINYIVIHTTQGSYAGSISWFQNSSANVSAHYIFRSSDGDCSQCVRDMDIGWHAGNWTYNQQSIGIEHEGWVSDPSWYTEAMYQASAALTKYKCDEYGIPKTRNRIIAHSEVPGATHTDPGQHWDWSHYMDLVTGGGDPSWQTTIDNDDSGVSKPSSWGTSTWSSEKYGDSYFYNTPEPVSDAVYYSADLPSSGTYKVEVWYASNSGYNDAAPHVIFTSSGSVSVHVDQRSGGGQWRDLGNYSMSGGYHNVLAVSRWTNGSGYVIADAVRISRLS